MPPSKPAMPRLHREVLDSFFAKLASDQDCDDATASALRVALESGGTVKPETLAAIFRKSAAST